MPTTFEAHREQFEAMVANGALVVCSHSGGKDSQAMYALLRHEVPADQLIVVHADLGEVEWGGVQDHIHSNLFGKELHVVKAIRENGEENNLLEYVERRGLWPDSGARYCTSDLKTGPIMKFARAQSELRGDVDVINCIGIRAEESVARKKKSPWAVNKKRTNGKRTTIDFLPIFDHTEDEVWEAIASDGQFRHPAYTAGMTRLSCIFCVLAKDEDLQTAARLNPDLARTYVELERKIDHTFKNGKSLAEIIGYQALPIAA